MLLRFCTCRAKRRSIDLPPRVASVVGLSAPLDSPSPFTLSLSELKTLADYLVVNSEGEAETEVVETIAGSVAAAIGYAHVPIVAVPAAATKNAVLTL